MPRLFGRKQKPDVEKLVRGLRESPRPEPREDRQVADEGDELAADSAEARLPETAAADLESSSDGLDERLMEGLIGLHEASDRPELLGVAEDLLHQLVPDSKPLFLLEQEDGLLHLESELAKGLAASLGKDLEPFSQPEDETPLGRLLAGTASPLTVERVSALLDGLVDPAACDLLETHFQAQRAVGYRLQSHGERLGAVILVHDSQQALPTVLESVTKHLAVAIRRSRELNLLRKMGSVDPVRWVPDGKELGRQLSRELARGQRYATPLSLVILSVANLEDISSEWGQPTANRLLRAVGSQLSGQIRWLDFLAAHGPRGYGIVLPHTDSKGAAAAAGRLVQCSSQVRVGAGPAPQCEVAISAFPEDGNTADSLLSTAESRLAGQPVAAESV